MTWEIYAILLASWNLFTFFMYGLDKRKAKRDEWRLSERTLICLVLFMGAIGAFLGMRVFHHKTRHLKFTVGVPFALALNAGAVYACIYFGLFTY